MTPQPTSEQKVEAAYEYLHRAFEARKRVLNIVSKKEALKDQVQARQDQFEKGLVHFALALSAKDAVALEQAGYETYLAYRQVEWEAGKGEGMLTIEQHKYTFLKALPTEIPFEELVKEGQELSKAFTEQTRGMRVMTAEDLKRVSK